MNEVCLITGMFVVTFSLRYIPIGVANAVQIPAHLEQALRYVLPSVLMAIISPAVLVSSDNSINISFDNPHLIAATAAFVIGFWRQSLILTIFTGMIVFFFIRLVLTF